MSCICKIIRCHSALNLRMTYGSQRFYLTNKNTYEYIMCSCVTCDGETHRHTVLSKGWIIPATQLKVITVNDDRMIGYHINILLSIHNNKKHNTNYDHPQYKTLPYNLHEKVNISKPSY